MTTNHPSTADILTLLQKGALTNLRDVIAGHNATFLVDVTLDGTVRRAVYKPCAGEIPLWDFPSNTLYKREYLAGRVSEALGWRIVPPTVIREGPHGVGSVQLFIDAVQSSNYFTLLEKRRADLLPIAVFDCLINNTDRKGGHVLEERPGGHLWGIDHGLSFHAQAKMRTVMWELAEEAVPEALRPQIKKLSTDTVLREELTAHLNAEEVRAFYVRVEAVLRAAVLPFRAVADRWRPYPWPPV